MSTDQVGTIRAKFSVKRSIFYVNFVKSIGIWCKLHNFVHTSGTEIAKRTLIAY